MEKARGIVVDADDLRIRHIANELEKGEAAQELATLAIHLSHAEARTSEYGRALTRLLELTRDYERRFVGIDRPRTALGPGS